MPVNHWHLKRHTEGDKDVVCSPRGQQVTSPESKGSPELKGSPSWSALQGGSEVSWEAGAHSVTADVLMWRVESLLKKNRGRG
jgi:hypothetical protein